MTKLQCETDPKQTLKYRNSNTTERMVIYTVYIHSI